MGKSIRAAVIGSNIDALQAALYLAKIGAQVKFITDLPAFAFFNADGVEPRLFWSTVLNAIQQSSIEFAYSTSSVDISGGKGNFKIKTTQKLRYIDSDLCTGCKKCEENCSTRLTKTDGGKNVILSAVHKPYPGNKSVPSTMVIDKNEISPCRASCPLGINVQGFISLLANNKVQEAYDLINRSAPLGGILGRLCKHPCESKCSRAKIDSAVSIRSLHRFAYDNVITPAGKDTAAASPIANSKIAIIGSGPAGLMAAWDLKRRGYDPTIFESHNVIGGMLATGIPRFRLSREIRERELGQLLDMGIKIRTGITVGRDIDFAYLKERDYKAFFLAIGASRNNKLGIAGEDLSGVIDCMSFLLLLNLTDDLFIGSNIVIIGDGNSAVDSARAAIRQNKGSVKIVSWTVKEELTASADEIQEASEEGVSIEYSSYPVEILGKKNKVTGVRFCRTKLTNELMRNGWHRPEPVEGTDFIIEADHVIVAIGQSADATQLNLDGLDIEKRSGTIRVNPLTLATNLPGVFAGGDCMRGPNNVVEAMADGLKAAESIDRYLSGVDLEEGRQIEPRKIAEIDLSSIWAFPVKRTEMPYLDMESRKNTYEETTTGFSAEAVADEAQRCLSCALCSECLECVKVCKSNAIKHEDTVRHKDAEADFVLRFPAGAISVNEENPGAGKNGVYVINQRTDLPEGDVNVRLLAAVMQTILDSDIDFLDKLSAGSFAGNDQDKTDLHTAEQNDHALPESRQGIFLCRCNGENSSVMDFGRLLAFKSPKLNVVHISEIEQACTEEGAQVIAERWREAGLDHAVIAACRCCNYEQVCYSCNDRRILSRKHLNSHIAGQGNPDIDYVNIRELCAWAHSENRESATDKALKMVEAAVITTPSRHQKYDRRPINPATLFIGGSGTGKIAAMTLEVLGCKVFQIAQLPDSIEIGGHPGDYHIKLGFSDRSELIKAGAIAVDASLRQADLDKLGFTYTGRLFQRLISATAADVTRGEFNFNKYALALNRAGLFIDVPLPGIEKPDESAQGVALAAEILLYLRSKWVEMSDSAAQVNTLLCRGCQNCAKLCPLIEMREGANGLLHSYLERYLCTRCGACASACPTGAIYLAGQDNSTIGIALKSYLCAAEI
ncbi:MAG: FAD-dependent oxidoreductase [Dehalococcoidia bacterium]